MIFRGVMSTRLRKCSMKCEEIIAAGGARARVLRWARARARNP